MAQEDRGPDRGKAAPIARPGFRIGSASVVVDGLPGVLAGFFVSEIQAVHWIVGYIVDGHVDESGVGQHRDCKFLAANRAQSGPAVGEGHGHTVQGAGGVQHGCEGVPTLRSK